MKMFNDLTLLRIAFPVWVLMASAIMPSTTSATTTSVSRDYRFRDNISLPVLENYLSRAVQYAGMLDCHPEGAAPWFEDNLRLIANSGAKFIGRSAYVWGMATDDEQHFANVRERAEAVHRQDPDIILQACVFEIVSRSSKGADARPGVDSVTIPEWVLAEFEQAQTTRTFDYDAMLFPNGELNQLWGPDSGAPDITQLETQMWFYYRACRYIKAGCEAIHFGQHAMIGLEDHDGKHWYDLLARVRKYAASHARHGYVLCDAHVDVTSPDRWSRDGRLLFDFVSFPLRPQETTEPLKAVLQPGYLDTLYGRVPGGIHPSGWKCDTIPQLYEFDNCKAGLAIEPGLHILVWGADESTWFANLVHEDRNAFLRYAYDWVWNHAPRGYLQMPGRRPAHVTVNKPTQFEYFINTPSHACPAGSGQEETMKAIWADPAYADVSTRPTSTAPVKQLPPPSDLPYTMEQLRKYYGEFGRK